MSKTPPFTPVTGATSMTTRYCPRCGAEDKPLPEPCTAERFRWDEDDQGHHCAERGPHTVHRDREHGCMWTEATG